MINFTRFYDLATYLCIPMEHVARLYHLKLIPLIEDGTDELSPDKLDPLLDLTILDVIRTEGKPTREVKSTSTKFTLRESDVVGRLKKTGLPKWFADYFMASLEFIDKNGDKYFRPGDVDNLLSVILREMAEHSSLKLKRGEK